MRRLIGGLGLPVHRMRLHIDLPRKRGQVVNPFFGSNHRKEAATVTPADIIYQRRCHVIERAAMVGVSRACREAGVSRTSDYRWTHRASRYGLSALVPNGRRRPALPNAIPAHQEEVILAEALARPTLGARRLCEHLAERGVHRSGSGVQKGLKRHHLGTRKLRVAALTAADTGLVAPRALGPSGFCLYASRPGDLVGLDAFYVGKLKGIGPVWQLTTATTCTVGPHCRSWRGKAMNSRVRHLSVNPCSGRPSVRAGLPAARPTARGAGAWGWHPVTAEYQ